MRRVTDRIGYLRGAGGSYATCPDIRQVTATKTSAETMSMTRISHAARLLLGLCCLLLCGACPRPGRGGELSEQAGPRIARAA